jgi:hypothetical protein
VSSAWASGVPPPVPSSTICAGRVSPARKASAKRAVKRSSISIVFTVQLCMMNAFRAGGAPGSTGT